MKHDAIKLRLIRESMGMTQEKLGILSNVSERTVQRAEAGHNMRLDTLSDFAAALEVPLSELVLDTEEMAGGNDVSLRRLTSGRVLMDELAKAGIASFDCEVDPLEEELPDLLELVTFIEKLLPIPWDDDQRPAALGLAAKIKAAADLSKSLVTLQKTGIGLFASASWISARYPLYDFNEGHRYTHNRQPYEKVATLQLLICRSLEDKTYRKAVTSWGLDVESPRPEPAAFGMDLDNDVPF